MDTIAFVFSGQGDQFPGMGKELYEEYPAAKRIFDVCERIRPGTLRQCFGGTEDELRETKNTQPCLYAAELAAAGVLLEKGIVPRMVAGFSLGELVAAAVSGVFDEETGFRLVCKRGELMQREADRQDTSMAAVLKLAPVQVEELCSRYPEVYPVNYNGPEQTVVAGLSSQLQSLAADVKRAGGKAVPLKVNAAFHSPFMNDAARAFAEELTKADVRRPDIPLYSNRTAAPYGDDAADLLSSQICSPVQWEKLICSMIKDGADTFIEIGPGRTLTNLIRRNHADVKTAVAAEYLREVREC